MPSSSDIREFQLKLREVLPGLAKRFGILKLSLFGSRVRGDSRPDSDLDVLVRFEATPSLLTLIEVENELSDLLGVKVDLVLADALRPHMAAEVTMTAVAI